MKIGLWGNTPKPYFNLNAIEPFPFLYFTSIKAPLISVIYGSV